MATAHSEVYPVKAALIPATRPVVTSPSRVGRPQDGSGDQKPEGPGLLPLDDSTMETSVVMEGGESERAGHIKQRRKRVKGVLKKVQDQLEFYFGDANLPRDKFLKEKMAEHAEGYVSVDLIASFNKMKTLTTDRAIILSAMEKSTLLQLSPDRDMVRRVIPLFTPSEDEVTARTVYVEGLSSQATHDQLQRLFKQFGTITYVSLPRHKPSGTIKGFAFIEFSTPQEAQDTVQFFKSEKSSETEKPSEGTTVKVSGETAEDSVFEENKKSESSRETAAMGTKRKRGDEEEEENDDETDRQERVVKKVKVDAEEQSVGREKLSQKVTLLIPDAPGTATPLLPGSSMTHRLLTPSEERGIGASTVTTTTPPPPEAATDSSPAVTRKEKRKRDESESSVDDDTESGDQSLLKSSRLDSTFSEASVDGDGTGKKKRRVHKKKRKASVADQLRGLNLRVMSKLEWLEMKQMYKQLQKEQMKKLKQGNKSEETGVGGANPQKRFVSNCLVKVSISELIAVSREQLKKHCSKYGSVAFVDVVDGQKEGYVRYAVSGCVAALTDADAEALNGVTFTSVSDEEEKSYFVKTRSARKHRSNTNKRKTTRGHDKVITKALQRKQEKKKSVHIRFSCSDDDDDGIEKKDSEKLI